MFYRWAKRLESMQMPATAFPAAGGDPAAETDESHFMDGALIAAAIASVWVILHSGGSKAFVGLDWVAVAYGPIFLVTVLGGLLVCGPASRASIAAHVALFLGIATLMGLFWVLSGRHLDIAIPGVEILVWGAFFAMVGLVTTILCLFAWTATLRWLATPRSMLSDFAPVVRVLCGATILIAALLGAQRALTIARIGL